METAFIIEKSGSVLNTCEEIRPLCHRNCYLVLFCSALYSSVQEVIVRVSYACFIYTPFIKIPHECSYAVSAVFTFNILNLKPLADEGSFIGFHTCPVEYQFLFVKWVLSEKKLFFYKDNRRSGMKGRVLIK